MSRLIVSEFDKFVFAWNYVTPKAGDELLFDGNRYRVASYSDCGRSDKDAVILSPDAPEGITRVHPGCVLVRP